MSVWYKLSVLCGNYGSFIGFTEELEVIRYMKRLYKDRDILVDEYHLQTEQDLKNAISTEYGASVACVDEFVLTMVYAGDYCMPLYRYTDEQLIEYVVDVVVDSICDEIKPIVYVIRYGIWDAFPCEIKDALVGLISILYCNIVDPYHSHQNSYRSKLNETLLLMHYIEEEGPLYYEGG